MAHQIPCPARSGSQGMASDEQGEMMEPATGQGGMMMVPGMMQRDAGIK